MRMTQSQQMLMKSKKKRLTGIPKKPHWRRPRDVCDQFSDVRPLKQVYLTPVELVPFSSKYAIVVSDQLRG